MNMFKIAQFVLLLSLWFQFLLSVHRTTRLEHRIDRLEKSILSRDLVIEQLVKTLVVVNETLVDLTNTTLSDHASSAIVDPSNITMGVDSRGVLSASANPDNSVDVSETNIIITNSMTVDSGRTLKPAFVSQGSGVVRGHLVVADSLQVAVGPNEFINISHWYHTYKSMVSDICTDPCVHGVINILTCECNCLPYWSGLSCDVGVCANNGTWSSSDKSCTCVPPWSSDSMCTTLTCGPHGVPSTNDVSCVCDYGWTGLDCMTPETNIQVLCNPLVCKGMCIDNECVCTDAQFGPNCEYECSSPAIDVSLCPWRSNWGRNMPCVDVGDSIVCSCGAAYPAIDAMVIMSELRCALSDGVRNCQLAFDSAAPVCCSPYGDCSGRLAMCEANDNACCYALSKYGRDRCIRGGCGWCEDARICVSELVVPGDCEAPFAVRTTGDWRHYHYNCDDYPHNTSKVCDDSPRLQFQLIYEDCYALGPDATDRTQCLTDARTEVDEMTWPWLSWNPPALAIGPAHTIRSRETGVYLEGVYKQQWSRSVPIRWTSKFASPFSLFFFVGAKHSSETAFYVVGKRFTRTYCLVSKILTPLERYIYLGSHDSLISETTGGYSTFLFQITDGRETQIPFNLVCTPYQIFSDSIFLANNALGLNVATGVDVFASVVSINAYMTV